MDRTLYLFLLVSSLTSFISCKSANRVIGQNTPAFYQYNRLIQVSPNQMEIDKLGNIYVLDHVGHLVLYNNKGNKKYEYADKRLGKISSFDVSNPLNILIYFQDQGIVKVLDNTLSEVSAISLTSQGMHTNAGAVCLSNDNNLWLYDAQMQKIVKLNKDLKVIAETNQFNDIGRIDFVPHKMIERNNWLAVSDDTQGILIFDNFGQLNKYFEIKGMLDFQFDGDKLIIHTTSGIKMQKLDYPDLYDIDWPSSIVRQAIHSIRIENNKWYVAYKDGIDVMAM